MLADLGQLRTPLRRPGQGIAARTAGLSAHPGDQRAVHQQIGIAPNRRGEMDVARQRQTEMPDIVRTIGGLSLAAQDEVVDQHGLPGAGGAARAADE